MPFETLESVFGEEAEPDGVQFQSFCLCSYSASPRYCGVLPWLSASNRDVRNRSLSHCRNPGGCSKIACSGAADMSNRPFLTQDVRSLTRTQAVRPVSPMYACSQSSHSRRYTTPGSSSLEVQIPSSTSSSETARPPHHLTSRPGRQVRPTRGCRCGFSGPPDSPQGKWRRLIVLHAGSSTGWVPTCENIFVGKKNTGNDPRR